MTEQTVIALLTLVGVLGAAGIAANTAAQHRTREQVRDMAGKIDRVRSENHALWLYTRILIDHIFKKKAGPLPAPPDQIKHLYERYD